MKILRSDSLKISYRVDTVLRERSWTLSPELKPDQLEVLVRNSPVKVDFMSGIDSLTFQVKADSIYDFYVVRVGSTDTAFTRVKGLRYVSPGSFSDAYKQKFKGKTTVEIPEIYELLNIVYAITPAAGKFPNITYRGTGYYGEVKKWFTPFMDDSAVAMIDKSLTDDQYFVLKMDAYSFLWQKGKILQSPVYDHTSWRDTNTLRPYIAALQKFAARSGFEKFYRQHKKFYQSQIDCYKDSINTTSMVDWLRKNFPGTDYDAFRIIFSPLVGANQSAHWIEDNGFKEMHAHVNFPYALPPSDSIGAGGRLFRRGSIVFTEINHSFINPESEKYLATPEFKKAFGDLSLWLDLKKPAGHYNDPYSCFNEYMNWGLVSLYAIDAAPARDTSLIISKISTNMDEYRGFKRFPQFNVFVTNLYRDRPAGATVASLYPAIIRWFSDYKD